MADSSNRKSPLIVHTESSIGWGGQEIRIMAELRAMRLAGFKTALIAPEPSRIYARAGAEGFPVYPVRFKNKVHIRSWMRLFSIIDHLKPDLVNTHSSDDSWMAGFVSRLLRVPLIIRTRHVSTPIGSAFSYRVFPHFILTTSQAIKDNLAERGLDPEKIFSVPTGIDSGRFRFSQALRRQTRLEHGMSDDDILVGNICVLRSWKGLDFFIETAARLGSPYKFILVGDGPQRERLEKKADDMCLSDRLIFAGHQEQIERYFCALDIFLFTSYANEGIPQSVLQARSTGIPIVACATASVVETLAGYEEVSFVEYGDIKAATAAIEETKDHIKIPESERIRQNLWVKENHDLEAMITRIRGLYRQWGLGEPG